MDVAIAAPGEDELVPSGQQHATVYITLFDTVQFPDECKTAVSVVGEYLASVTEVNNATTTCCHTISVQQVAPPVGSHISSLNYPLNIDHEE